MKKIFLFSLFLATIAFFLFLSRSPLDYTNIVASPSPIPSLQNVLGEITKKSGCVINTSLPDKACTPGAVDSKVIQDNIKSTICVPGYTQTVRPPVSVTNKIKLDRMKAYDASGSPSNYELDHLIPLELGGCPDCIANLWPEPASPIPGYHQKDVVENFLHKEVCNGIIPLQQAQDEIANDWLSVYKPIPGK